MIYINYYEAPYGKYIMYSDGTYLNEINIYKGEDLSGYEVKELSIFDETKDLLDKYFSGCNVDVNSLKIDISGTPFKKRIWDILKTIPYGEVMTYSDIANILAKEKGIEKMSNRAVGSAIGKNPISILIPCHRVVGKSGSLTGYAGGIKVKEYLLKHEGLDMNKFFIPKKGNKL